MNPNDFYAIVIFVIGLCIGSFMNVCIYRLPSGESIVYPPSHCPSCGSMIKAYQLIPVVSYITLKGRCGSCKARISLRYPVVELLNGTLWLSIFMLGGLNAISGLLMLLSSGSVVTVLILYDRRKLRKVS